MCGSDKYQICLWEGREQKRTGEGNLAVAVFYFFAKREKKGSEANMAKM